jgi:hypothetical protein
MRKYRIGFMSLLATLLVVFVAGCGQETVTLPGVVSVTPAQGSVNVAVSTTITATFSEAMSSASISTSTFTLAAPGGVAVTGTVAYSGGVATFTPSAALANSATYTATITTGAATPGGAELIGPYVWSFTTVATAPPPAPTVIATVPVNSATLVPVTQVLSATFNVAMNCTAFPAAAFTVTGPGVTPVPGTIGCTGAVATFTPANSLAFNTLYTATITTGATSLAGTPLAANYVWRFLTLPAPALPTVIATVPLNGAVNVPFNQALTAAFSVAMTPASISATTFTLKATISGTAVTGVVTYVAAGSVATFVPSAPLAATTEYTATITTGAMDTLSNHLAQNYNWTFTTAALPVAIPPTVISTIPLNLATAVPLNQIVSAIFSVPMTPATINSSTFTLTYLVAGVPTPVPGLVAYVTASNSLTFTPTANLPASTLFTATITTAAQSLAGTPMASNYVWTFTTGTTVAAVPPVLVSTVPANVATLVPLNQAVSATFSKAMNPGTFTSATYYLTEGLNSVGAAITLDPSNTIATLTPTALLTASTTYTVTVTDGVTDATGNPLANTGAPDPWTFTTGPAAVPPPVVLGPTIVLFGGFGGFSGMTNQGTSTVINGNIGSTGASTLMTGFHDISLPIVGVVWPCTYTQTPLNIGQVNGVIDTAAPPPNAPNCPLEGTAATAAIATTALSEAQTAYTTLHGLASTGALAAELGGTTITPGVYTNATTVGITSGDLTLDAQGNGSNAYWVFQVGSALTVGEAGFPRNVILINGAESSHVFWAVGSAATINGAGGGTFVGTVIAQAGISVSTAGNAAISTINGRLIALTASTTLVNTVINLPTP